MNSAYVFIIYEQSSHAKCDLDLQASDMVLALDTMSCHDDYLCKIILKSHHAGQSYGRDMILSLYPMHKVQVHPVSLTFKLATCFLHATCLPVMIFCAI